MDSSGGLQVLVDAPRTVALSEALHALAPPEAAERLRDESDEIAARALALVNPAEAADILGQLSAERRDRIIAAAPDGRGEQWRIDLQYDEASVGRLMERPLGVFRPETTVVLAWFAGRIYRVGILMYGKKPTIPEILRWVRYSPGKAPQPEAKVG